MLKLLLIDDEKDALEALEWKINKCIKNVSITKCSSSLIGVELVKELEPDIVFLDIQMPEMDGFTFINQFPERKFTFIFTTAYDDYAIKAVKVKAFDYLLKPIDIDELTLALTKAQKEIRKEQMGSDVVPRVNISADGKVYLIPKDTVLFLKSDKSYTSIHLLSGKKIVATKTLKEIHKKFICPEFFRVHNSYVINLNHVIEYNKGANELTMQDGTIVSISRGKKNELLEKLYLNR